MQTMQDTAYAGFDDYIGGECNEGGGGNATLAPGVYSFEVREPAQRERFSGSEKLPPCWKAGLTLHVDGRGQGQARAYENIYLTKRQAWKLKQFFVSLGLVDKGADGFQPPWNQIVGRSGVIELGNREYNGRTYNEVREFLDPDEGMRRLTEAIAAEGGAQAQPAAQGGFSFPGAV